MKQTETRTSAITIELNGEPHQVAARTTVSALLQQLELTKGRLAVEYNLEILPRSEYGRTQLQARDRVEIVQAIGGG